MADRLFNGEVKNLPHPYVYEAGRFLETTPGINLLFGGLGNYLTQVGAGGSLGYLDYLTAGADIPGPEKMFAPALVGAVRGIKRLPKFFHGTRSPDAANEILQKGFTRGSSAELNLPGTSLSEDPLVSFKLFAHESPSNMLEVTTDVNPSDVYNLRPSEYKLGITPQEPQALYKKPNYAFKEAETFALRKTRPDYHAENLSKHLLDKEDALINELNSTQSKIRDISSFLESNKFIQQFPSEFAPYQKELTYFKNKEIQLKKTINNISDERAKYDYVKDLDISQMDTGFHFINEINAIKKNRINKLPEYYQDKFRKRMNFILSEGNVFSKPDSEKLLKSLAERLELDSKYIDPLRKSLRFAEADLSRLQQERTRKLINGDYSVYHLSQLDKDIAKKHAEVDSLAIKLYRFEDQRSDILKEVEGIKPLEFKQQHLYPKEMDPSDRNRMLSANIAYRNIKEFIFDLSSGYPFKESLQGTAFATRESGRDFRPKIFIDKFMSSLAELKGTNKAFYHRAFDREIFPNWGTISDTFYEHLFSPNIKDANLRDKAFSLFAKMDSKVYELKNLKDRMYSTRVTQMNAKDLDDSVRLYNKTMENLYDLMQKVHRKSYK